MKRFALAILIVVSISISAQAKYSGGSGTSEDPYQIADACDLLVLSADANDYGLCFILTADVNMEEQVFSTAIIAADTLLNDGFQGTAFTGSFNGSGNKITSFNLYGIKNSYIGLFGQIDSGGSVRDLGLENYKVNGARYIGGLAGNNLNGTITGCYSTGKAKGSSESRYVGGLAGSNSGSIINCYSMVQDSCSISSYMYAGGLVGGNGGSISNCYSMAPVSGGSNAFGGLVGINWGSISDCYSTGSASGSSQIGGFAGSNTGNIVNCHSTGQVRGFYLLIGGFVGQNMRGSIADCYSTGIVSGYSGSSWVGGFVGGNDSGGSSSGTIDSCFATGSVSIDSGGEYAGGFVGGNYGSDISNCYSMGSVSGYDYVGGFVGRTYNDSNISSCYSTGLTSGSTNVGGLVGKNESPSVVNACFWDTQTSDQTVSDGGEGKMTAEMKTLITFTSAGWDFVDTWGIGNGQTYPYLKPFNGINTADLNYNGIVDFEDFAVLAENWLKEI